MTEETYECDRCYKTKGLGEDLGPYKSKGEYICQECYENEITKGEYQIEAEKEAKEMSSLQRE